MESIGEDRKDRYGGKTMIDELIDKIRYFVPILFSEEDRLIFLVVMTMIVTLPVLLCI